MRTADAMNTAPDTSYESVADAHDPRVERVLAPLTRMAEYTNWLGLATYDPFDIKSTPLAIWTYRKPSFLRSLVRKGLYGFELFFPLALRKVMGIEKKPTAGGTARYAQACLSLYRLNHDEADLTRAKGALQWLLDHPGKASVGKGWGVPFDWQTFFETVPANTAVSHTTQGCGNAFLDYHEATGEAWARAAAEECCEFLTHGLNQTERPSGSVALSYTPLDTSQVANTNAESAALLVRCGRPQDQDIAWKVAHFVCEAQNSDGSWFYSAPDAVEGNNPIDNYHTGMLVSGLMEMASDERCKQALNTGLAFHLNNHFLADGCPKMRPNAVYPIDSYSAGQSIACLIAAAQSPFVEESIKSQADKTLDQVVEYTLSNFVLADGSTVYRRYKGATMRIDSMRWAQALLLQSLADYCDLRGHAVPTSTHPCP